MEPRMEKKVFKAAIINTDELVKAQARDVGDARMTESKEDRSGNRLLRTIKRVWKHNLAQEWYRQREVSRARKEILESENLYAGEKGFDPDQKQAGKASDTASKEAMQEIVNRFTSEYEDEMLKEEERDSKRTLDDQAVHTHIKDLIRLYAGSDMPDAAFEQAKKRILSSYDEKYASAKSMHVDNLLSIAKEVKDSVDAGVSLKELAFDIEITLGTARETLDTEAHLNSFDRCVEKMQNSKIGKYIANEPAALGIVAGLWEVGRNVLQKGASSKAAQWATFGGAALAAGGISAVKERARVTRERAQHQRESAKGAEFKDADMKRRAEMEKNSYDTKKATSIIQHLDEDLAIVQAGSMEEQDRVEILGRLADVEARLALGRQQKIDLITYDKFNTMEKDRNTMNELRAQLKVALRDDESIENFDTKLEELVAVQKDQLLEGDRGIKEKDKVFTKLRNTRARNAFIKTTLVSATLGTVFQETKALFDGGQDGVLEGALSDKEHLVKHGTALEALRRSVTGDHTMVPEDSLYEAAQIDGTRINLPEGVTMTQNPDGTFNLLRDDEIISKNIPVTLEDGHLSKETVDALAKDGITEDFYVDGEKTTTVVNETAQEYVKDHAENMHQIHRELWYDNDTPHPFDQNELRTDWGGEGNTGIDAKGNYVFNVSRMTADGSVHASESVDATTGGLKMLFSLSRDTQHLAFEVPVNANGNVVIDPKSELGKLLFTERDGHAVFTGQFAEVAQTTGVAADGGENVRILSTHVGPGKDMVNAVVDKDTLVPNVTFHIPDENTYDVPFVIPVGARRPLERGAYKKDAEVRASRPTAKEDDVDQTADTAELADQIPAGSFRADVADTIRYSPENGFTGDLEETIAKETDHVYGFAGANRNTIETKLKEGKKYKHPEVLIFESDTSRRTADLKQMEDLKKWNPNVKFTYVALPKNIKKIQQKWVKQYSDKRLEHIMTTSKVDKKVKHEMYAEKAEKKVLGPVSGTEWNKFMDKGTVSRVRLQSIVEKLKINERLSAEEEAMRAEKWETIDALLKK